jgi:ATP synthase protein I
MLNRLRASSWRKTQGWIEPFGDLYKVLAIDLPHARRLAFGVVLGQVVVSAAAALCALGLADRRAAISALVGGGIATVGSLVMATLVFAHGARSSALRIVGALYVGEAVKVAVVIALFVVALKWEDVAPLAMFVAFAATYLVYWIALLVALPGSSSARGSV